MKKIFSVFIHLLLILILTILTQVGGIVYLFSLLIFRKIHQKLLPIWKKKLFKTSFFMSFYLLLTCLVIPLLAPIWGREALPVFSDKNLKPLSLWTCLLNRHYAKPELKEICINSANQLEKESPNTVTSYMDANFPFFDGFPLLPHLSHNDGKKIDLAFFYTKDGEYTYQLAPTFIGYGGYELPKENEEDRSAFCHANGYFQYSFTRIFPTTRPHLEFDASKTKRLTEIIINQIEIQKIFIEPHLQSRLGLWSEKVRFHGCGAVRHDDHIHIQL